MFFAIMPVMLPFLGVQLLNRAPCVETKVYVKPTNTGLLLHYHGHVDSHFNVIKKCTNKFDCLVNEMLCIQYLKPALNVQSDSLRAKVFM